LPLARRLVQGTLTLGEAFAFMSGLYFRGKLAYGTRFGRVLVITPTRGLMPPETPVSAELLREFAAVDVDADDQRYRTPLDRSLRELVETVPSDTRIVLLGSIASSKYVEALTTVFGSRLEFPADFVGRGDMSRGGLMLRPADAGRELDYVAVVSDVSRHGPRPPKLDPLTRVRPRG
jgi:hypothetical protein